MIKLLLLCLCLLLPAAASADPGAWQVNAGNRMFKQGKFDDSILKYNQALAKTHNAPVVEYDLGTALYKKGDYASAVEHLSKAAQAYKKQVSIPARYNLGNALYKRGMAQAYRDLNSAISDLKGSLANYKQVLDAAPKDRDAQYNYNFVRKQLERLKKKKQQQEQQQQQNKQNQQNQQRQNQQQQQEQNKSQQGQQQNKQQASQHNQEGQSRQQQQNQQQNQQPGQQQDQNQQRQRSADQQQKSSSQNQEGQQAGVSDDDLSKKEAKDMLQDYERNDQPQGLLDFIPRQGKDTPVQKDW